MLREEEGEGSVGKGHAAGAAAIARRGGLDETAGSKEKRLNRGTARAGARVSVGGWRFLGDGAAAEVGGAWVGSGSGSRGKREAADRGRETEREGEREGLLGFGLGC